MRKIAAAFLFALLLAAPARSYAGVFVSVAVAPPPLVVYEQPLLPGPGYIWMPGYWSYDEEGWYWVPGAWVLPPEHGLLWTPGYWEYDDYGRAYIWHAGYWGPHVGFYGGVPYGYGYTGVGYYGGYWERGVFFYNSSCTHYDRTVIRTTYVKEVVVDRTVVSTSGYNGGPGRHKLAPTQAELAVVKEHHVQATAEQMKHQNLAMSSKETHFNVNHGRPAVAATLKAGDFSTRSAVAPKGPKGFDARAAHGGTPHEPGGPAGQHPPHTAALPGNGPDGKHGARPGDPRARQQFSGKPHGPGPNSGQGHGHGQFAARNGNPPKKEPPKHPGDPRFQQ